MTIYWERCDFCGLYKPTSRCAMFPELSVDFMCCVSCPLWMNTCKSPTWKISTKPVSLQLKSRGVSAEERKRVFEELMKSLESSKS
ncbi:MAG: hypothetical protein LM567_04780 [Desulfurococcaceae archaeon]|nr:hypothetical protein [Desulfurococcaceae archaeon]